MSTPSRIPGWSKEEILSLAEEQMFGMGNDGICVVCGEVRGGCEPDARNYPCESCGKQAVYGASELVLMGFAT